MTRSTTIDLRGPYDLREVALMGFGHRDEASYDGVMRLAFPLDGDLDRAVGVEVRQDGSRLDLVVHDDPAADSPADLDVVARQVARIVSADHDGDHWARVCAADPVLSRLHDLAPGFRPALFHSAYDATVWSVLSARRPRAQGIALRTRLSEQHGTVFELAGQRLASLPGPTALRPLPSVPGLPDDRLPRLTAIADAALTGRLEVARLAAMDPDDAMTDLQQLPGIGPFYSSLVVIRACGLADVLSTAEPHTRANVRAFYGLDHEPDDAELNAIAEAWRPFRTWAAVTLRAVGSRVAAPA